MHIFIENITNMIKIKLFIFLFFIIATYNNLFSNGINDSLNLYIKTYNWELYNSLIISIENKSSQSINIQYYTHYIFNNSESAPGIDICFVNSDNSKVNIVKNNVYNSLFKYNINPTLIIPPHESLVLDTLSIKRIFGNQ